MIEPWVNKFISIPFSDCGRNREGTDCWGLACVIYKELLGIDLPLLLEYNGTKDVNKIYDIYETEHCEWIEIPFGEEKEFDILVYKMMGLPTHVGVVFTKGIMIHCERGVGTNIVDYNHSAQWKKRLVGIYRYAKHKT